MNFEQVELVSSSAYVGQQLSATNIRADLDTVIVAIRRSDGRMIFNPSGDISLEAGDILVAIGRAESLARLNEIARNESSRN